MELSRAAAEVATRRQDLVVSQANLRQRENALKEMLVRTPDAAVEAAEIIALDRIEIPETDDLPPVAATGGDGDGQAARCGGVEVAGPDGGDVAGGDGEPALAERAGDGANLQPGRGRDAASEQWRRSEPVFRRRIRHGAGADLAAQFPELFGQRLVFGPLGNRTAQGDYGIDQLQFRQSQITGQRDTNAIVVDISARMSALRQARARHSAAVNTRTLQEQLLAADREKFSSGMATFNDIINDQRALVVAQISEVNALAAYAHARVSLDQTLGETLERNKVSLDEGLSGRVARESKAPEVVVGAKE